jgi:hypothetical protein
VRPDLRKIALDGNSLLCLVSDWLLSLPRVVSHLSFSLSPSSPSYRLSLSLSLSLSLRSFNLRIHVRFSAPKSANVQPEPAQSTTVIAALASSIVGNDIARAYGSDSTNLPWSTFMATSECNREVSAF